MSKVALSKIVIRQESEKDFDKITDVINQAFAGKPYADGDESDVVLRLRDCAALSLGLVAEVEGEFVGHIAFSPVTTTDGAEHWYALGPVAVYPHIQSQGLGAALINEGLDQIKNMGGVGCMLTGNPDYYKRFGFEFSNGNAPTNEPAEFFMVKRLSDAALPEGPMSFHHAFYAGDSYNLTTSRDKAEKARNRDL